MAHDELPVPVRQHPHWRVVIRPIAHEAERLATLGKCWELVEQTQVSLRGWNYPHVSSRDNERGHGSTWVASWADFMGHVEYWRMYQSGQFLHLVSVREATRQSWRDDLRETTRGHLAYMRGVDVDSIPGFIDIENFIYSMTEIFEFAARLAQRQLFDDSITVAVELHGIKGFVLTTGWERAWHSYYAAQDDVVGRSWDIGVDDLVAESANKSIEAVGWFFERFGWLDPPMSILKQDQLNFLSGRR